MGKISKELKNLFEKKKSGYETIITFSKVTYIAGTNYTKCETCIRQIMKGDEYYRKTISLYPGHKKYEICCTPCRDRYERTEENIQWSYPHLNTSYSTKNKCHGCKKLFKMGERFRRKRRKLSSFTAITHYCNNCFLKEHESVT